MLPVPLLNRTVYPHACGERALTAKRLISIHGLSPRLWGTGCNAAVIAAHVRFIPTPVGNGFQFQGAEVIVPVYPHACGERRSVRVFPWSFCGLSPRLWGTVKMSKCSDTWYRFIPTPVGNGSTHAALGYLLTVYPHACGERSPTLVSASFTGGLSPRLWGTVLLPRPHPSLIRFIPTPVGNGQPLDNQPAARAVYPHACGERFKSLFYPLVMTGLSPRLWGTDLYWIFCDGVIRFIPTPVGNGVFAVKAVTLNTVYPHACGERTI